MKKDENDNIVEMYGFKVGETVLNKIDLMTESKIKVPAGSFLLIVAIAPKVRKGYVDNIRCDSRDYFFNAVILGGSDNDRLRENFCTIKKFKSKHPTAKNHKYLTCPI